MKAIAAALALLLGQEVDDETWRKIAPHFVPPPEAEAASVRYPTPLKFTDGRPVRTAAEWQERRREILEAWHRLMGPWPPLLEKPVIEVLAEERRETFAQRRVRVPVAPEGSAEGWLLVPDGAGPFPAVLVVYYEPETSIGRKGELRDFAYQLTKRGFVTLSIGTPASRAPQGPGKVQIQPLSWLAYAAANCHGALAALKEVRPDRIGVTGHSYGGKWAMFASCLFEKFACGAWSDGGIVFDEKRPNVNYWEPWYLGAQEGTKRKPGVPKADNPRTGAYAAMVEKGLDLHELHALMAPRPFLVSGGSEDPPERWAALHHAVAVNRLLGRENRVAMTNRKTHGPTPESNEALYLFFEHVLKR